MFYDKVNDQYTLAIRGSDQLYDDLLVNDIFGVFGNGIATDQVIDLYNYYQRLITSTGSYARQIEYVAPDIDPITGHVNDPGGFREADPVSGLGKLSSSTQINVTGHSLGGHLAAAFSRLFPGATRTTYEINGLGFYDNAYVNDLFSALDGQASFDNGKIYNLYGDAGPEVATNNNPHTQYGTRLPTFIEDQGSAIGNHGKELMTDALALASVFATIDPSLNTMDPRQALRKLFDIMEAAAGTPGKSLENALDALRTLFQQNHAGGTANGNASPTATDRDSFYANLYSLQAYLKNLPSYNTTTQGLGFTVEKLADKSVSALVAAAQTDMATRYALYKLTPFVVKGAGLYEAINADHALDRYDAATGNGALIDEYLKDRASFLYNKVQANNKDNDITADATTLATTWVPYSGSPQYFEDRSNSLPYKLYLGPDASIVNQSINGMSQIKFGGVSSDTLTGGTQWDKLYGMAGADTLQGGKGNDYLEGGQGSDTYLYTAGDGLDTLLDTDGLGRITFDRMIPNSGQLSAQTIRRKMQPIHFISAPLPRAA